MLTERCTSCGAPGATHGGPEIGPAILCDKCAPNALLPMIVGLVAIAVGVVAGLLQ